MGFIDYADLKTRVSITDAVQKLGLELHNTGNQRRGFCPRCMTGGDRALVVTPEKNLFYCFNAKIGGDCIALVAHLKDLKTNEAANWLAGTVPLSRPPNKTSSATPPPAPGARIFDPAAYAARLDASHEALAGLGISADTIKAFKAGYASTGLLRGRLALPVCDRQGKALCYTGRALKDEHPPLVFPKDFDPKSFLFNWERAEPGDVLYVARDPLDVLKAHEGGLIAVSFLGEINSTSLQVLSLLMDELNIPSVEIL